MRVSVFGLGYVGAVNLAVLRGNGHTVIGVDIMSSKVDAINDGRSPVGEPKLEDALHTAVPAPAATATTNHEHAVRESDVAIVCVGTPARASGDQDLGYVDRVLRQILNTSDKSGGAAHIILRSSVPPGTHAELIEPLLATHSDNGTAHYAYYPEFLREGQGLADFSAPGLNVYAPHTKRASKVMHDLFQNPQCPLRAVTFGEAEMLKYASNSFHALKVAFANEMGAIADALDIDGRVVMDEFATDTKLNVSSAYLRPGFAFGGACLPKDTRALVHAAERNGVEVPLLASVLPSNERRIVRLLEEIERLAVTRIGFWGITFKPGTDDTRESPVLKAVDELLRQRTQYERPVEVVIGDEPAVLKHIDTRIASVARLTSSPRDFAHGLDLAVLGTRPVPPEIGRTIAADGTAVIDLGYFDTPTAIADAPGYRRLA